MKVLTFDLKTGSRLMEEGCTGQVAIATMDVLSPPLHPGEKVLYL